MRRNQIVTVLLSASLMLLSLIRASAETSKVHSLPDIKEMPINISVNGPFPTKPLHNDTVIVSVTEPPTNLPNASANVTISLTMPGMSMPPNIVTCHAEKDERYHGFCIFTMPGKWKMEIRVHFRSNKTYTAVRNVTIQ